MCNQKNPKTAGLAGGKSGGQKKTIESIIPWPRATNKPHTPQHPPKENTAEAPGGRPDPHHKQQIPGHATPEGGWSRRRTRGGWGWD